MHQEIKENLAATNVSGVSRTRSSVSGGPVFREGVIQFGKPRICAGSIADGPHSIFAKRLVCCADQLNPPRKADIPFEIVSTSDKKVAGNGMRMRAIADSGPGNRAPPNYSRGLRQPLPSMTRLAPARSSQT